MHLSPVNVQVAFDEAILRELHRNDTIMSYARSLRVCRDFMDVYARNDDTRKLTVIPVEMYREWCLRASRVEPRLHKFRGRLHDKRGVGVSVRCARAADAFIFFEKVTAQWVTPDVYAACKKVPCNGYGALVQAVQRRTDLTDEQKEIVEQELFDFQVKANRTGNHYRNHYIRASNPYGHSQSARGG